ncbi:MAG TPA: FAD-dependent oxidoreductase [Candidatus Acidoferrales bacterium]|nr:FAD-dependent oxidoreductase [Candidatus Acidoferrales bacterium]
MSNTVRTGDTPIACDVLVIGGGAAGVAAAAAAGRAGARVVVLERYGFLGGLATAAQVGTICGLYLRDTTGPTATAVGGGFAQEFADRLQRVAGVKPIRAMDTGLWVLPYPPPAFAQVADSVLGESKNVTIILHATVAETEVESARLKQVRALAWNEPLLFQAKAVVDGTGEATAAALSGAQAENGGADQAPALVFVLENVDPDLAQRGLLEVRRELRRAVENGSLPALCERLSLIPGSGAHGRLAFKLSLLPAPPDRALWQQVTDWEREARGLLEPLRRFLVENIAACRNARLDSVAPQLGVRSGRRILGRARLADEDVLSTRKFPSGIARGCWPMERWTSSPRPEMTYFSEGDYYEIAMDCLRPAELENVWVAGRCFSATTGAMTSARVIGTALATGWAAGTAAAFQAGGRPLNDAVTEIRRSLHQ